MAILVTILSNYFSVIPKRQKPKDPHPKQETEEEDLDDDDVLNSPDPQTILDDMFDGPESMDGFDWTLEQ